MVQEITEKKYKQGYDDATKEYETQTTALEGIISAQWDLIKTFERDFDLYKGVKTKIVKTIKESK